MLCLLFTLDKAFKFQFHSFLLILSVTKSDSFFTELNHRVDYHLCVNFHAIKNTTGIHIFYLSHKMLISHICVYLQFLCVHVELVN